MADDLYTARPMYRYLVVLTVASTVGLQVWRTLFNNFAVEVAHLQGAHVGIIQSVREVPGFLALLAVYLILWVREHRMAAAAVLALAVGVGATGLLPSFAGLVLTTLMMSFGFHYYETANQSLTLQYFDRQTAPVVFGRQRSWAAAANIAVGVFVFVVKPWMSYRQMYLLVGAVLAAMGLWAFFQHPVDGSAAPQRKRMILRRRYWLYYLLTFLAGARRQIFIAFSVFLLVERFGYSVQAVAVLFLVNNAVNYFLSPAIGKAIVRFGERKVLSVEYASLVVVFAGYAFCHNRWLVALLYILDHVFFNFAIAIRTYFQKIGDPRDIAPSMAVGFTINHIAAVVLPAVGGLLWMVDYRIPFFIGIGLSLASLAAVQAIRVPTETGR